MSGEKGGTFFSVWKIRLSSITACSDLVDKNPDLSSAPRIVYECATAELLRGAPYRSCSPKFRQAPRRFTGSEASGPSTSISPRKMK